MRFPRLRKAFHIGQKAERRTTGPDLGVETIRIVRLLSLET